MVEGGATLNWALISQHLVYGTGFFGSEDAVNLELSSMEKMDDGVLLCWHVLKPEK